MRGGEAGGTIQDLLHPLKGAVNVASGHCRRGPADRNPWLSHFCALAFGARGNAARRTAQALGPSKTYRGYWS
jgi:hypothetical protein